MDHETAILDVINTMTDAFAQGDINTVMNCYAQNAVVVGEPGKKQQGDSQLRAMFGSYIEAGVNFRYGKHEVIVNEHTALHLMKWTHPQIDGNDVSAMSVAVLQKQADGTWKMIIDHPFGDGVMNY